MIGYRGAIYNSRDKEVEILTWDEDGNRISMSVPCFPYFYVENIYGSDVSVFDTKLVKKEFDTRKRREEFIKKNGLTKVFDYFPPVQQALLDTYWKNNEDEDFSKFPLKIYYFDIESVGPGEHSKPEDPFHPINVITIYDSLSKHYHVWGLQKYESLDRNITYRHFKTEYALLDSFLDFFAENRPDLISGWNIEGYDIPYIIRRIDRVLGENNSNRLSPTGMIYTKNVQDDFGNVLEIFKINGLEIIDYLDAYKKFCPEKRESNKLDYVGEVELGTKKLDYGNISLYELMTTDWDTFVEYNIQDVRMLTMLEQKLKYIELVRMLAYIGCTPFETALQTVGVVVGTMSIFARKKNKKLCTFIRDKKTDYPGGFVADPIVGHHKDIITFDANSLYPNVMITCNMSNETKVGKIVSASNDNYVIRHVNGKTLEMTGKDFLSYVKRENLVLSKAKVLFSQKKKGIAADLVDVYYKKRVETKSKLKSVMIEYEELKKSNNLSDDIKKQYENNINFLDTKQLAEKIFLNSVYGAYGNRFCSIGDDDIASSITLTGQYAIKTARKLAKQFISNKTNITDDKKLENCLLFGDTDSIGVCFSLLFPDGISDGKEIYPEAYQMANELETHLNSGMQSWAKKSLNSADPRFKFKREIMCDAGIFLAKKRYVFHILDKEGFKTNKWKYTGVELVRTTMPKAIKPYVKEIIHTMILTKSEQKTNEVLIDVYDKFKKLSINELSLVSGVNKYMKYSSMCDEFNTPKGMPCATKASYFYNLIIKKLSLLEKYEEIRTGDKVKYFYVEKPNRYMLDAIAFKNVYPEEFKTIFKIDTEKMFEKDMFKCIERFYKAMNWVCRKPNHMLFSNLEEEFS